MPACPGPMGGGGPMTVGLGAMSNGGREISGELTDDCESDSGWEPVVGRLLLGPNSSLAPISSMGLFARDGRGGMGFLSVLGSSNPPARRNLAKALSPISSLPSPPNTLHLHFCTREASMSAGKWANFHSKVKSTRRARCCTLSWGSLVDARPNTDPIRSPGSAASIAFMAAFRQLCASARGRLCWCC